MSGAALRSIQVALGATAAGVAVAAALGFVYHDTSQTVTSRQSQLDALRARTIAVAQPTNTSDQTVRARLTQLRQSDAVRVSWDGFMSNLGRVLPEDVWLTGMQVAETAPAARAPSPLRSTPNPAPAPDQRADRLHDHRLHVFTALGRAADAPAEDAAVAQPDLAAEQQRGNRGHAFRFPVHDRRRSQRAARKGGVVINRIRSSRRASALSAGARNRALAAAAWFAVVGSEAQRRLRS